jgi:cardiolipin synthase
MRELKDLISGAQPEVGGDFLVTPIAGRPYVRGTLVPAIGLRWVSGSSGLIVPESATRRPVPGDLIRSFISDVELFGIAVGRQRVREWLRQASRFGVIRACSKLLGERQAVGAQWMDHDLALAAEFNNETVRLRATNLVRQHRALVSPQGVMFMLKLALRESPVDGDPDLRALAGMIVAVQSELGAPDDGTEDRLRSLEDEIRSTADHFPSGQIETMAVALAAVPSAGAAGGVVAGLPTPLLRAQASDLIAAWKTDASQVNGAAIALALRAAGATAKAIRGEMTVEPVWTGPATAEMSVRLSRAALLEVIGMAHHRLILVSYAAYKVGDLVEALVTAHGRGVDLRFVLETSDDSEGALSFDASAAFSALVGQARFYVWPAAQRPPGGKLHVKAAIADEYAALVTSANLTGAALSENMELGLLVKGGSVPRRLSRHFMSLMDEGVLSSALT